MGTLVLQINPGDTRNVREQPTLNSPILRSLAGRRVACGTGAADVAYADGYRWRRLSGQEGWLADARVDNQNHLTAVILSIVDFINDDPALPNPQPSLTMSEVEYFTGQRFGWYQLDLTKAGAWKLELHMMHEGEAGRLEVSLSGPPFEVKSVNLKEAYEFQSIPIRY